MFGEETTKVWSCLNCSLDLETLRETGWMTKNRSVEVNAIKQVRPFKAVKVSNKILKRILKWTGSHWRSQNLGHVLVFKDELIWTIYKRCLNHVDQGIIRTQTRCKKGMNQLFKVFSCEKRLHLGKKSWKKLYFTFEEPTDWRVRQRKLDPHGPG